MEEFCSQQSWLTPAWCRPEGENNLWQCADHAKWTEMGYVHPIFSGKKMGWEQREAKPQQKSHTGTKSHTYTSTHITGHHGFVPTCQTCTHVHNTPLHI